MVDVASSGTADAAPTRPEPPTQSRKRGLGPLLRAKPHYITVPLLFIVVILIWQYVLPTLGVKSYTLPKPSEIWSALGRDINSAVFWHNVRITVIEAIFGYAVGVAAAVVVGTVVAQSRVVERTTMPYVVAFQSIPIIALAPLFVVWFGFGQTSKVLMAAVICFFPMLVNVIEGLHAANPVEVDMMRSFGARRTQIFMHVQLPAGLPFAFAGLDVGAVLAILGAVVGEFVGAKAGLGYDLLQTNFNFDIPGLFADLVVLGILGIVAHVLVRLVRGRVVFWQRSK